MAFDTRGVFSGKETRQASRLVVGIAGGWAGWCFLGDYILGG